MHLTLSTKGLSAAVKEARRVIPKKDVLPLMSCVLIDAADGEADIVGTDSEAWRVHALEARVESAGTIAVPAKRLAAILSALSTDEVQLSNEATPSKLEITAGGTRYGVLIPDAEEYPFHRPEIMADEVLEIPLADLSRVIAKVMHALPPPPSGNDDEEAAILRRCVSFRFEPGRLTVTATDGKRVAVAEHRHAGASSVSLLVGATVLRELLTLKGEGIVQVRQDGDHVSMKIGRREILGRLEAGELPDAERLLSDPKPHVAVCGRRTLLDAARRVAAIDDDPPVTLRFLADGISLSASVLDQDAHERIDASYPPPTLPRSHEPVVEVALLPSYLCDFLAVSDADLVRVCVNGPEDPVILAPVGGQDLRHVGMIAPQRLNVQAAIDEFRQTVFGEGDGVSSVTITHRDSPGDRSSVTLTSAALRGVAAALDRD